jgi:hypothetical protein
MDISVGLFHFNVQWSAGDISSYHRYCAESIRPFLDFLKDNPRYRVSVEFPGCALEFLSDNYPCQFESLAKLQSTRQVELISSLYAPTLWVAFPWRDLQRSIQANRNVLARLGLVPSRIFFSQEAFFGDGARMLTDYFDVAICKDDQIEYFLHRDRVEPMYKLGSLKVLVASNHILNEVTRFLDARPEKERHLSPAHSEHVRSARTTNEKKSFPALSGAFGEHSWRWYHCGDGNHFSTVSTPDQWRTYRLDTAWASLVADLFISYEENGYQFATVGDLARMLEDFPAPSIEGIIEGSWHTSESRGVAQWMGLNASKWEDDEGLLSYSYRTRSLLAACEDAVEQMPPAAREFTAPLLDKAWQAVFMAQSSDPLGWYPSPGEVRFGRDMGHQAYAEVQRVVEAIGSTGASISQPRHPPVQRAVRTESALVSVEKINIQGETAVFAVSNDCQVIHLDGYGTEAPCGIAFRFALDYLVYCPSGLEESPVCRELTMYRPEVLVLPLANGLLAVGQDTFVVKDAGTCHVAAHLDRSAGKVRFLIEGHVPPRHLMWRFYLFRGSLPNAVRFANDINGV